MAQNQRTNNNDKSTQSADAMIPLLAQAALSGGNNEALNALIADLTNDLLERRTKEKARRERLAASAVQTAQEQALAQAIRQRGCSHKKQDGKSRLVGQILSGTQQLALVCQFCGTNFHEPPEHDQLAPPKELIPSRDEIGG